MSINATSARKAGPPEPSITQPPFKIRSNVMEIACNFVQSDFSSRVLPAWSIGRAGGIGVSAPFQIYQLAMVR